jgi:hypothetical protein
MSKFLLHQKLKKLEILLTEVTEVLVEIGIDAQQYRGLMAQVAKMRELVRPSGGIVNGVNAHGAAVDEAEYIIGKNKTVALTGVEPVPDNPPPPQSGSWENVKKMWETWQNRTDIP